MDYPPPRSTITILCSGVALGVYIPALLLRNQLKQLGASVEVRVLESLFREDKQKKILENKLAFHQSFAVAKMGQRIARDIRPNLDEALLEACFQTWAREERRLFIVFSGFWMPLIESYRRYIAEQSLWVYMFHMDSAISTSWKNVNTLGENCQPIWMFDFEARRMHYQLKFSPEPPLPYGERPCRYLVHGGGWGMGTYQDYIPILRSRGLNLDIVAYSFQDLINQCEGQRYFMVDPAWTPWGENSSGEPEFPPFGEIRPGETPCFYNRSDSHELFQLSRSARAIVSKPGGATLLDSWAAATPLVMLEPFGEYEAKNALLWQEMGFGISFPEWAASGYSLRLLETLHDNLLRSQPAVPDYAATWFPRFQAFFMGRE